MHLELAGDAIEQINHYNGRKHDHLVGGVYDFSARGFIIACALNSPDSKQESTISD